MRKEQKKKIQYYWSRVRRPPAAIAVLRTRTEHVSPEGPIRVPPEKKIFQKLYVRNPVCAVLRPFGQLLSKKNPIMSGLNRVRVI